jgi:tetratricopeptide (TPR) repeat protein
MDPGNPAIHILTAKVCIEQGQLEQAATELDAARDLDKTLSENKTVAGLAQTSSAEADYLSGAIYQRWQQPEKALSYYESACRKAPNELSYFMARAETMVALGQQDAALKLLQDKVVYFEHSAVIRDAVGMLLMEQRKTADAAEMFRRATILAPDDLSIREHLALALFQNHEFLESGDLLSALMKEKNFSTRSDLQLTLAECQLAVGRAADARITAQAAADLDPNLPAAWLTLAKISLQIGDLHRADASLQRAITLAPESGESELLLGYLRLRQERLIDALEAFRQASVFSPADSTGLCMAGYVSQKLNHPREAADYYARALKVDPKDSLANQFLAELPGQ